MRTSVGPRRGQGVRFRPGARAGQIGQGVQGAPSERARDLVQHLGRGGRGGPERRASPVPDRRQCDAGRRRRAAEPGSRTRRRGRRPGPGGRGGSRRRGGAGPAGGASRRIPVLDKLRLNGQDDSIPDGNATESRSERPPTPQNAEPRSSSHARDSPESIRDHSPAPLDREPGFKGRPYAALGAATLARLGIKSGQDALFFDDHPIAASRVAMLSIRPRGVKREGDRVRSRAPLSFLGTGGFRRRAGLAERAGPKGDCAMSARG